MIVINRHHEAEQWLTERLADGPVPRVTLHREAATLGIARSTLGRAADNLGIISEPLSQYPRRTAWRLP